MKLRAPQLILLSCLLMVLSGPAYSQSLTSIAESDVQAMLDGMDKAARKGNIAGMIAPFASDIKIKMTLVNPATNKEMEATITKEQYATNARRILRRKIAYQFERKNTRIKIYDLRPQRSLVNYTTRSSLKNEQFAGCRLRCFT